MRFMRWPETTCTTSAVQPPALCVSRRSRTRVGSPVSSGAGSAPSIRRHARAIARVSGAALRLRSGHDRPDARRAGGRCQAGSSSTNRCWSTSDTAAKPAHWRAPTRPTPRTPGWSPAARRAGPGAAADGSLWAFIEGSLVVPVGTLRIGPLETEWSSGMNINRLSAGRDNRARRKDLPVSGIVHMTHTSPFMIRKE